MDLTITRIEANEIAKYLDFEYANDREYANLCTFLEETFGHTTYDIIVAGLSCQQRGTPSMAVDLTIGLAYCVSTGKIAHSGSLFGPISITNGGGSTRIDTLEIRLLETDYDEQQRALKDPVSGDVTYQDIDTKTRFEIEAQVIQGTGGAGIAPNGTAGWIKIAEITVDAGETTSILDADIENCTGGYDSEETANWTAEEESTFRIGTVADFKALFRINHDEDGDYSDDSIKDAHIDWGVGAGQVSAVDVPIADAGSLIIATDVENALQELAALKDIQNGFIHLSLTNYNSISASQVAANSYFDVNGTLVKITTNTTPTGSPSAGNINYIYSTSAAAISYSTTTPTWNDLLQGWYNGTSRAVAVFYYEGTSYKLKAVLTNQNSGPKVMWMHIPGVGTWYGATGAYDDKANFVDFNNDQDEYYSDVPLIHNTLITEVRAWADTDSGSIGHVYLIRAINTAITTVDMAHLSFTGGIDDVTVSSITNPVVDRESYHYSSRLYFSNATGAPRLFGMRIKYLDFVRC